MRETEKSGEYKREKRRKTRGEQEEDRNGDERRGTMREELRRGRERGEGIRMQRRGRG